MDRQAGFLSGSRRLAVTRPGVAAARRGKMQVRSPAIVALGKSGTTVASVMHSQLVYTKLLLGG